MSLEATNTQNKWKIKTMFRIVVNIDATCWPDNLWTVDTRDDPTSLGELSMDIMLDEIYLFQLDATEL